MARRCWSWTRSHPTPCLKAWSTRSWCASTDALPLYKRGTRLYIAVSDPTNLQALDEIKFNTGCSTEAIIAEEDKIDSAIDRYLESQDTGFSSMGDADLDELDIEAGTNEDKGGDVTTDAVMMRLSYASSIKCCWMPSRWGRRIFASSPTKRSLSYPLPRRRHSAGKYPARRSTWALSWRHV
ncbi:MAG: hypothetical protein R3F38_05060 [Gammaproteobacteria bacterium]